jgi:hypothetical protein
MCSRETNRLPATEIEKKLGCKLSLPLELRQSVTSIKPSDKFFIYYFFPWEIGLDGDPKRSDGGAMFILTEVVWAKEIVLDRGEAGSITINFGGYQRFEVKGKRLGRYEFYCPFDAGQALQ